MGSAGGLLSATPQFSGVGLEPQVSLFSQKKYKLLVMTIA
jgi:hypothetical protein